MRWALARTVSPNSQIPANHLNPLHFPVSRSNDIHSIIAIDSNANPCYSGLCSAGHTSRRPHPLRPLLTPKSRRPSCPSQPPLESTLPQVFIPINLNSLGFSVYEKPGALLWLTRFPARKSVLTRVARKDPSPQATTGGSDPVGKRACRE